MKKILYPILAVVVFLTMQSAVGIVITVVGALSDPELAKKAIATGDSDALMTVVGSDWLAAAVVLSGILTVAVIALLKMIDWKQVLNVRTIDWKWGIVSIVAAIFGIFALDVLEEMMDLPNLMEDTFTDMSNSVVGALCIGVAGPVLEEFIFREGMEGYMLRNGVNKWGAIMGSALAFGIIHLNPAQVPFAFAMGIILGVIYYKSGNIVLTSILHVLNNSIAVWQMHTMGEELKDFKLVDWMGGTTIALVCSALCLVLCVFLLTGVWKKYHPRHSENVATAAIVS